jgi:hypothetical protein
MKVRLAFFLLLAASLSSAEWHTATPTFNHTSFTFQMPQMPEETTKDEVRFWKTEIDGNSYCVAAKPRKCSQGKAPLKVCDFVSLIRESHTDPENWKLISILPGATPTVWNLLLTNPTGSFYLVSICANDDTVFALMTKTADQNCPEHQKLTQSFHF